MTKPFASMFSIDEGDTIELDDGFTCHAPGQVVVKADRKHHDLYFECNAGRHFLHGQLDHDGRLVGIWKVKP